MLAHEVLSWHERVNTYQKLSQELVIQVKKAQIIIDDEDAPYGHTVCVTTEDPRGIKKSEIAEIWLHYKMGTPDFRAGMDIAKKSKRVTRRGKGYVFHGGAVRFKNIYNKSKIPPGARQHQLKVLDPVTIADQISRFRPYIYGTKKDIHDPECQITIKADLWFTRSTEKTGLARDNYMPRASLDLATGFIYDSDGKLVDAVNTAEILSAAEEALDKFVKG